MPQVRLLPQSLVPHFANPQRGLGSSRLLPPCSGCVAGPWDGLCPAHWQSRQVAWCGRTGRQGSWC